jgi:hypothetical protein
VFFCIRYSGGELVFIEPNDRYFVTPSMRLQQSVDDLFGEETYFAKADTTPPERQRKPWERNKFENGNGNANGED